MYCNRLLCCCLNVMLQYVCVHDGWVYCVGLYMYRGIQNMIFTLFDPLCTSPVVFMDEAGLPEESHESLKVSPPKTTSLNAQIFIPFLHCC